MHSCGKHKQTANDHIASYFFLPQKHGIILHSLCTRGCRAMARICYSAGVGFNNILLALSPKKKEIVNKYTSELGGRLWWENAQFK